MLSTRLINSGRKARFSSSMSFFCMSLYSDSACLPESCWNEKPRLGCFLMADAPTLEVIIIMALRKSTFAPLASESCPSSRIWSKMLNVSGWAFSISSKTTIEYGRLRIASVNCPASSYPTYPGGDPTKRAMLCRSINSDMSSWINASGEPNKKVANALVNSVLPTPVGPRKMNEPIGRRGLLRPARARRTALEIALIASSCPTISLVSAASIWSNRADSSCVNCATGMPVHMESTSAMSSGVTLRL